MKDLYILIFLPKYTEAPSKHAPDVLSLGYHADETGSSLIILHIHTRAVWNLEIYVWNQI